MVYTLTKGIEKSIPCIQQTDHPYANRVDTSTLCKVINKCLNYILINHYEKERPANNLEILYTNLCKILADNIGNFYIEKFIYQVPGPLIQTKNTRKKVSLYTHTKVDAKC